MTEKEFNSLKTGGHILFSDYPGRHGVYTGESTQRGEEIYIKIREANMEGFHRIALISLMPDLQTIESKIDILEFSDPNSIRQHLVYQKLCGRLAEVIYSMEATNTEFKAYQYKPVLRLLDSPGSGILIADEVGLGKTIEAWLIWTELRARFDYSKLIVVCPANLRKKWIFELFDRFNCDARECYGAKDLLAALEDSKKRKSGFALVCGYHALLPPSDNEKSATRRKLHELIEELSTEDPVVDLLVVDEAHYVRNMKSKTNKALRSFIEICRNTVLLSATPVHLGNENLFSLLNLIDDDTFSNIALFEQMVSGNEPIIQAIRSYPPGTKNIDALKNNLQNALSTNFFRNNEHLKIAIKTANEDLDWSDPANRELVLSPIEKSNLFNQYIVRNRKRDVEKERVIREVTDIKVTPNEDELDLYNELIDAITRYAESKNLDTPGFLLSMPERQFSSCIAGTLRRWESLNDIDEDFSNPDEVLENPSKVSKNKIGPLTRFLISEVFERSDLKIFERADSKFDILNSTLTGYFEENPGKKIIIFSTFKFTLSYLQERLARENFQSMLISGDLSADDRWKVLEEFEKQKDVNILLSSEVGSEGIDLQFCSALVNYDLPWNPMKIEQRIGRIDRIGQPEKTIKIFNFYVKKTIDEIIHNRLWKRISIFENILGDVELILQKRISKLTQEIYSHKLTFEQKINLVEQTAVAIEKNINDEKELENQSSDLVAFYDIINQRIENSRNAGRWVSAADVEFLFKDFFKIKYHSPSELKAKNVDEKIYEIKLSEDASHNFRSFLAINPSMQQVPTNFSHHKFGKFKFTNKPTRKRQFQNYECVDQFHPIIRFAVNELKDSNSKVHPLSSSIINKKDIQDSISHLELEHSDWAFFFVERWTFELITTIEKLNYVLIKPDFSAEEGLAVEKFVNFISENGKFSRHPEIESKTLNHAFDKSREVSSKLFSIKKQEFENEVVQKAKFQKAALERTMSAKTAELNEKVQEKRWVDDERAARQIEGKIQKTKERLRDQIIKIEDRLGSFDSNFEEVCAGIVIFN